MINFTRIAKFEFERVLAESIEYQNDDVMQASDIVKNMALIAFTRFAKSSSLYFSLGNALSTSSIGLHVLNAMRCRDGVVMPEQVINLMASVLFCNIGIIKGVLEDDDGENQKISSDKPVSVDNTHTDSSMWSYKAFRSKKFIQDISFLDTNTNFKIVSRAIEYADFFRATPADNVAVDETAKYVRAIQIISLMSDNNYDRKMVEFYLSAKEAGLIDEKIFKNLAEFREKWVHYFWERLYPDVGEEILLLRETSQGRAIVSQMYSHL
jgi:hypothetical protein